jgi:hypothetical protein
VSSSRSICRILKFLHPVQMKNLSDHLRGTTVLGQELPTPDNSEEEDDESADHIYILSIRT